MAVEVRVPRLGWSMEEGTFVEWLKREGDDVRPGEPLFAIEGDKAVQEVEAIGTGRLRIAPGAPQNGDTVKVGALLAILVAADEAAVFPRHEYPAPVVAAPVAAQDRRDVSVTHERRAVSGPRISPRAARVAAELDVDWRQITGTGKQGRVRERDVRAWARGNQGRAPAGPASLRRTIVARLSESADRTVPVTLTTTADATNLVGLRSQFKAAGSSTASPAPGYTDIMVKLVCRALQQHPALNSGSLDDEIFTPEGGIHIAVAIDTPAGLVAPVVRDVPSLGLRQIAARIIELKERALQSRLQWDDLAGGTFTISNLGSFGIDAFTPIITLPQCAILGVGRIERRAAVVNDKVVPCDVLTLSLTFDHCQVDGAPAARFLASLREAIENPGPRLLF